LSFSGAGCKRERTSHDSIQISFSPPCRFRAEERRTLKLRSLLCLLGCVLLAGCATGNNEDDVFFNRGWIWPKSMDEQKSLPLSDDSTASKPE
jgi:hypothetical protein